MIKFSLSVACLLALGTFPSHASLDPNLPAGALLPPRREPFGIDIVEELKRQQEIEDCRLVKVQTSKVRLDKKNRDEPEEPVRYVYTCP